MEKYKTTKAIRFKLEAQDISEIQKDVDGLEAEFNLANFVSGLSNYLDEVKKYLFCEGKEKSFVNTKMTIKREWLQQYAKQEWVDYSEKKKQNSAQNKNVRRIQMTIGDFTALASKIEERFGEVSYIFKELADAAGSEANERAKRERIGLLLKRLLAKNTLPFLFSLIENSNDKNETYNLSIRLKNQSLQLAEQLTSGVQVFLPAQSGGLPVAKASFNYYTINKKPMDFSQKKSDLESDLKISLDSIFNLTRENFSKDIKEAIKADIQKELNNGKTLQLGDAPMLDGEDYASLRQILKNIKSNQKKAFSELMQTEKNYHDLEATNLYLLNTIENEFNAYKEQTNKLEDLAEKINQASNNDQKKTLISKKQRVAKDRGNLMKDKFATWKSFANFYQTVSQKHGRILAQLKGIEKEQTESQLLKYWALILENNWQHKLILIPRENAAKCKRRIASLNPPENNQTKLFWFESLTYRSLQKLCFGFAENANNEFNRNIQYLLPKDKSGKTINGEFAFQGDEQKKIKFYQDVLASEYAKSVLNIPIEEIQAEIINQNFASLDDFQIALERTSYRRFAVVDANVEAELLKKHNAQIFTLTSSDLKKPAKENIKSHTQIWKAFWSSNNEQSNFEIRLNPEITITYRQPKQSRIDKYGENSSLYDPKKKNRYLHPQFTLITTISEQSNSPTKILSFMSDDEFKKSVDAFNKKFKKDDIKFAFGIDNGEVELSTLGVYLLAFDKTSNEEKVAELNKVNDYGFEVLTIKNLNYKEIDKNGKERKIIQNPSYFLKKENYIETFKKSEAEYQEMFAQQFEKKKLLALDLTTAKVICGHIVTNGDVPALFNLWLKHAQRNIFAMNDHIKKETAKKIDLKNQLDTVKEKLKFAEYISHEKKFKKLDDEKKRRYTKWIFEDRDQNNFTSDEGKKFNACQKRHGNYTPNAQAPVIFASCFIGEELQSVTDIFDVRHIFKKREDFYAIKTEEEIKQLINSYNIGKTSHDISNEELDLKILETKKALVANAVGVIDFLYKHYQQRLGGEGLIIKEGFGADSVEDGIEKFSGNIYRILERKLYQKFQNYGLVPPIKSLMAVRAEGINNNKDALLQLGNVGFIDPAETSQECPVCVEGRLSHSTTCSKNCGFSSEGIMHSNDGIAGFNIAKRGFINFVKSKTDNQQQMSAQK
ncbi:MAG: hypothetical protein RQ824_02560 [bacterium]|nr:hypothetical protein [bacterium]